MTKTPGQIAYEQEVKAIPLYHDKSERKIWSDLPDYAKKSWEKEPTPRLKSDIDKVVKSATRPFLK